MVDQTECMFCQTTNKSELLRRELERGGRFRRVPSIFEHPRSAFTAFQMWFMPYCISTEIADVSSLAYDSFI